MQIVWAPEKHDRMPTITHRFGAAVAELPPGFARPVMHDVEGYGHAEIEGMLGRPKGIKSQLHKGIKIKKIRKQSRFN